MTEKQDAKRHQVPEFNFLLFDAESENHNPENSPPPPQEFNFLPFWS